MIPESLKPKDAILREVGNILFITKWNWSYLDCLGYQKRAQTFIQNNRSYKIYIFTNHPHCFTLGRGNERNTEEELIEFNQELINSLKFPVHKIHRGGGITFHYPGQWIFYPIISISPSYTLDDHMCWLLKSVKHNLQDNFQIKDVLSAKKLMGVWYQKKKIASIGIGLNRFVTEHGIAVNLISDQEMSDELSKISPCGMDYQTYISLDSITKRQEILLDFHKGFLNSML